MTFKKYHPPHIYLDDREYYLSAATYNRQAFFSSDEQKRLLRDILREKIQEFSIKLYAWVILDNHYHLLIRVAEKDTLPKLIQSLHGASSFRLNQQDKCRGRSVWSNYWDRCPRSKSDFYTFFNYIHINPIKHGEVTIKDGVVLKNKKRLSIPADRMADLHDALSEYEFSSYPYYLRKYGREGMSHVWMDYPIADYLAGDE